MTAPPEDQAPEDQPPEQGAPAAPRRPMVLEAHGDHRVDEWFWLRYRDDPEVLALLEAENAFTEAQTAHLAGLREGLYAEMKARIVETDLSVPVTKGPWWYYVRTVEGADYGIHCRLPVSGSGRDMTTPPSVSDEQFADEQVLLD